MSSATLAPGSAVELRFAESFHQDEFKLFEVSEEILSELRASELPGLPVRGSPDTDAVLCTSKKTFSIRLVETSNTLLLMSLQQLEDPQPADVAADAKPALPYLQIDGAVSCHYDLEEIAPRVHILRELLSQCPYRGVAAETERLQGDESNAKRRRPNEPESASSVRTYSLLELQRLVQASDAQLKTALSNLDALSIDEPEGSKWRVLDAPYSDEVFDLVLATLTQLSVSMFEAPGVTAADLDRLCDDLAAQDYPRFVIQHVLRMHSSTASTDDGLVLDGPKVARFRAQQIFRACPAGQLFPSAAFVSGWADMLPRGVSADVQLLRGMALMEQHPTHGSVYRYLPAASLPPPAALRFSRLLKERAKWTLDEIDPYIRDLVAPGQTIEQLLLKNMRVIKTDKSILYGAK